MGIEDVGVTLSVRDDRQYEISHQLWSHTSSNSAYLERNYKKAFSHLISSKELPYRVMNVIKSKFCDKNVYYV